MFGQDRRTENFCLTFFFFFQRFLLAPLSAPVVGALVRGCSSERRVGLRSRLLCPFPGQTCQTSETSETSQTIRNIRLKIQVRQDLDMKEELAFGLVFSVLFQVRQVRQVIQVRLVRQERHERELAFRLLCPFPGKTSQTSKTSETSQTSET